MALPTKRWTDSPSFQQDSQGERALCPLDSGSAPHPQLPGGRRFTAGVIVTTEQTAQAQVLVGSWGITSQRGGGKGPVITSPSLPLRPRCQAHSASWLTGIWTRDQCLQRDGAAGLFVTQRSGVGVGTPLPGHPLPRGSPQGQLALEDSGCGCQPLLPPSASRNPGPLSMPGPAGTLALALGPAGRLC